MKTRQIEQLILVVVLSVAAFCAHALDTPHNPTVFNNCVNCHDMSSMNAQLLRVDNPHPPENIDDTIFNNLCWSCHNGVIAPFKKTHSSLTTDNGYGNWAMECRTCHNPHSQVQTTAYFESSYLASGTSTGLTTTTLTQAGAGWSTDEHADRLLIPNTSQFNVNYRILGNTSDTLTLGSLADLARAAVGDTFAIIYGKLIKHEVNTPNSGTKPVRFFQSTGANSFADGNATLDGICEVCHTQTNHFRNNGAAPDQGHSNVGGVAGQKCTESCHLHSDGFAHGGGGTADVCIKCHGHEAGTLYDPDATYPHTPGALASRGAGSATPHSTHTEFDADDKRGPQIYCNDCHDANKMPSFKSGTDANGDGKFNLAETDVCNACHSSGGTYDGVNDTAVGAKVNWHTGGVYTADGTLKPGKEKWCAGCHDESPSVIANQGNVSAPNVVGDEDGSYTYGTGWGFYKTGHGLANTDFIPSTGGMKNGPGKICTNCHDSRTVHIDAAARSFDCGDGCDSAEYRTSYRLKKISGQEPMTIPYLVNNPLNADTFRLCFSCHDSGPYTNSANMDTNMKTLAGTPLVPVNRHEYHLAQNSLRYPADFNYASADNSRITCVVCHNVHGSTNPAMLRNGTLIGREPGLKLWYNNDAIVTYNTASPNPPTPANLPLSSSTGTVWISGSSSNLCSHCHGNGNVQPEYRTPFQPMAQAPSLAWIGESGYVADGANPDSGPGDSSFEFRVKFTDTNNDLPSMIQVWVDQNDNGSYEPGEKYAMVETSVTDTTTYNGKTYAKTLVLAKAGDGIFNYRFHAADATADATGIPTGNGTVQLLNDGPLLAWTSESGYAADGVSPNYGANGGNYVFRVNYSDGNNECPPTANDIQVWVDANDNGSYEADEKHNMSAVDAGDANCANGKLYTHTKALASAGDGSLNYRFYASDGFGAASGTPTANATVQVSSSTNNPPELTHEAGTCRANGARPARGANGADFEFRVKYTDGDNQCPSGAGDIQVWIDENDNGSYEPGEKYNLSAVDAGDANCMDGKLYATSRPLAVAGDGVLNYRFYATDGVEAAVGEAASVSAVTVLNALKVRPTGGAGWYSTIQTAVTASTDPSTILVYPNADFTAATYNERVSLITGKHNRTIQSVCGADMTVVASNTGAHTFTFQDSNNPVVDGFSITGATIANNAALYVNRDSAGTGTDFVFRNNKLYGNDHGVWVNDSNSKPVKIQNSQIYSNTTRGLFSQTDAVIEISDSEFYGHNTTVSGAAINLNSTTAMTIDRSVIRDNVATGGSGGIYYNGDITKILLISNSVFADNQGTNGGAIQTGSGPTINIVNTTFTGNRATNGGVFYMCAPGSTTVRNSIFWNNTATTSGHTAYKACSGYYNGFITITDSDVDTSAAYFGNGSATASNNIDPAQDPLFVNAAGDDYHIQPGSPVIDRASAAYAPDDDIDGQARPVAAADDMGADEISAALSNTAPVMNWTVEGGYSADGVEPDSANSGSNFVFHIDYTDGDNNPPSVIQVWVDLDRNGVYAANEKFDMTATDAGDSTYSNGKRYAKTLTLTYAGGGSLDYRFYASDGKLEAGGTPTQVTSVRVGNNIPSIAWTGEANYGADGTHPDSGDGGSNFVFRIDYRDTDNTVPNPVEVWVDMDDSGSYDAGESFAMTESDAGDTNYTDGKRYARTLALPYVGDGVLSYRFYASDGMDDATGTPGSADKFVTVTMPPNQQPTLSWQAGACRSQGVSPAIGAVGGDYEFQVNYSDADNQCAATIQVWIDENDNGSYESGEKYDLTQVNAGDTVCTDGKLYKTTRPLAFNGDGVLTYRFHATDGLQAAAGAAATGSTLTVLSALKVRPTGGTGWYSTIQAAVTASTDPSTIVVYPNADFTAATYTENVSLITAKNNRTIRSACGADLTIVASASGNHAFLFQDSNNPVVDGFSITGATAASNAGIYLNRTNGGTGTDFVFRNNKLYGNNHGVWINDSDAKPVKIQNSKIYSNSSRGIFSQTDATIEISDSEIYGHNTTANGAAISLNSTASTTITRSVIRDNVTSGGSGGIYVLGAGKILNISNSVIAGNTGTNGGAIQTGSGPTVDIVNSTFADNQATSYGGAFYVCATGSTTVRNSIFWNNTATTSGHTSYKGCGILNGYVTITNSNVTTGGGNFVNGTPTVSANIDPAQNPLFVNAAADDYHIQSGSPVINQASATYAPADDIDGQSRPLGAADDMGADEKE